MRQVPRWPPNVSKLVRKNGMLLDPKRRHLAYCPTCLLDMHPSYFSKHSESECLSFQLEIVEDVQDN